MNRTLLRIGALTFASVALLVGSSGCGSDASCSKPAGTVTVTIVNNACGVDFATGALDCATSDLGYNAGNLNGGGAGGLTADVGAVAGLCEVTSVPTAGFAAQVQALAGEGYVVKTKGGQDARVYITSIASNGANIVIEYQYPFK
jgi:hypothetical protein